MTDNTTKGKPGPLEGVRVIEYAVFHAGPCTASILGDLGADVIKIEAGLGDPVRLWKKVAGFDMAMSNGESFMNHVSNRNKRGMRLNIKKKEGLEVLHRLVAEADVFITNLRKSTKVKLGIDYQSLSKINPRLVHANISGYGPEGPMADLGAYDSLGQAVSGMMYTTGDPDPQLIHLGVLDQSVAVAASHAVITALYDRERRGVGQEVHASLYGTAIWLLYCNMMLSSVMSIDPTRAGDRTHHSPLRNRFRCGDGKWVMSTHHPEDKFWAPFCTAFGREDLIDDPRFAEAGNRAANCQELVAIFDEIFEQKTRDQWMELFRENGLLFVPIQTIAEVRDDPQALASGYMVPFEHPEMGKVNIPGYPLHFSACEVGTKTLASGLGEHTGQILKEAGYSDEEVAALLDEGVAG